MKYMLTWTERSQGSPIEYENAQKRILEVFTQWKSSANFKIELFVIRVGDWGGYMMLDCDDPTAVHKFCSMLPAFVFEARPVIPIEDAVRVVAIVEDDANESELADEHPEQLVEIRCIGAPQPAREKLVGSADATLRGEPGAAHQANEGFAVALRRVLALRR